MASVEVCRCAAAPTTGRSMRCGPRVYLHRRTKTDGDIESCAVARRSDETPVSEWRVRLWHVRPRMPPPSHVRRRMSRRRTSKGCAGHCYIRIRENHEHSNEVFRRSSHLYLHCAGTLALGARRLSTSDLYAEAQAGQGRSVWTRMAHSIRSVVAMDCFPGPHVCGHVSSLKQG